jgi:UDP:flavonoid glycosyltransferase YjiC (YdhE family)
MTDAKKPRKKILFFSHAVTMAHFSRPLKWIEGLDLELYDVYLASEKKFRRLCPPHGVKYIDITCLDAVQFSEDVVRAAPMYDLKTFEKHILEDIEVMNLVKPDLVIGDFRHSLSVSCRLQNIRYVNITNAYWSPKIKIAFPLPEAPAVRKLGEKLSSVLLSLFLPFLLKINFFKMVYLLRKPLHRAGLSFSDYRQVITDGDVTIYCDTPELIPLKKQSAREKFIGPMVWSMDVALPDWWPSLDPKKKRVFLSLGSSGPADSLPLIVSALAKLDVEVIVALAGKKIELPSLPNVHITDFLPIEEACEKSDLIICNGGSPMCHAALTYGVPTIGIVCNNDQLLNMAHVESRGAGRMLRFWNLSAKKITKTVQEVLENPSYAESSRKIKAEFDSIQTQGHLQNVIEEIFRDVDVSQ